MWRPASRITGVAVLLAASAAWAGEGAAIEAGDVAENLKAWVRAFNAHDAKALAAVYSEDADSIEATGARMEGRAGIEKGMAEFFAKNPEVQTKVVATSRRFLEPDVVVEDGTWEQSRLSQRGLPTRGLYTTVLVKRGGTWMAVCDRGMAPTVALTEEAPTHEGTQR